MMRLTRLYADAAGESHFDEITVDLAPVRFAPPAPPVDLSRPFAATQLVWVGFSVGWHGDWHPVPCRQGFCFLAGTIEVRASDGETQVFGPGDCVLAEDTTGRGHVSRNAGDGEALMAVTQLAAE